MSDMDIIAAPIYREVELCGKMRKIGTLTIGDMADFEQYFQDKRERKLLDTARSLYPDGIPESVLDKALAPLTDAEVERQQSSVDGVRFFLWCALKKHNPDMTLDEAAQLVTCDQVEDVMQKIMPVTQKKT